MQSTVTIWQQFSAFQSTPVAQRFLKRNYEQLAVDFPEKNSYDNCYSFIYYLEHGKKYYQLAANAPTELKPVLLFYGMIQLLKACILTVDPSYPANTSMLAHGVSTRKRKKRDYIFMHDEVKVQKNGLLAILNLKMLQRKTLPFERIRMDALLIRIPELNELFQKIKQTSPFMPTTINNKEVTIPLTMLDTLKMTERRFKEFFNAFRLIGTLTEERKNKLTFVLTEPLTPWACHPFYFHVDGNYVLPNRKELYDPIHEIIIHYLLLYNLSMILSYETEWWNELFYTFGSEDLTFIQAFLEITAKKVPILLYTFLNEKSM